MELIDKSALITELERRRDLHYKYYVKNGAGSIAECKYDEDKDILSFLNTLEIKEVNLEKELDEWMRYGPHTNYPWCTIPDAIKITAEYFFELGLKAQKGE